jgi:hypothetical protein
MMQAAVTQCDTASTLSAALMSIGRISWPRRKRLAAQLHLGWTVGIGVAADG